MTVTREYRILELRPEVRAAEDGKKRITGYAVRWMQRSVPIYGLWIEQFAPGAFAVSLSERANDIFATWQHNVDLTLGRSPNTLSLREDDLGLFYDIDPPGWASAQVESVERGDVRGSSFTFESTLDEWDWDSDPNYVIRTVKRATLYEVAPVTLPAYPSSTAGVRSDDAIAQMVQREMEARKNKNRDYQERGRLLRDLSLKH